MVKPTRPAANGFVRAMRHAYNPLGFSKGYNFILCRYSAAADIQGEMSNANPFSIGFLAIGYLLGFTLSRLEYFSYNGIFCNGPPGTGAAPGECYYWLQDPFKIGKSWKPACMLESDSRTGMKLHLYCILPASLLVCLQFVPVIRHKVRLFHRLNGYVVIILSLLSSAGTIIITRHAFGGDFATQTWTGAMVILTTIGYTMAW